MKRSMKWARTSPPAQQTTPYANDDEALQWLAKRINEFVSHIEGRYRDDPRVQALVDKYRGVTLLQEPDDPTDDTWKNGKFKHSTGVLYVAVRDLKGHLRTESSLLKTVVHELAHATRYKAPSEDSHSQAWKQTWLWFLSVATEELGWTVDIKCAECTFYGLCDRRDCPKCAWLQNLCRPYAGPPTSV